MLISTGFTVLACLAAQISAYTNPLACSGTCTNTHDPDLIQRASDGTYFRFATGGGIAIHTSPGIQGPWTYKGYALAGGSKINNSGNKDLWAPDISLIGSTYYLYYAVSAFGTQNSAIGVATSKTMEVGSWTDLGSVGVTSSSGKSYNAIDANLLQDGGNNYLQFGSFWGDIYQVKMASTPTSTSGAAAHQIAYQPANGSPVEGSFLVKRDGLYYLFFSEGQCCNYDTSKPAAGKEYKIMACRSTSPTGGFVDKNGVSCTNGGGTVVLASHDHVYGPGGQSVYLDAKLGWVLVYHYVDTTIGYADGDKRLGINKLYWSGGWPSV